MDARGLFDAVAACMLAGEPAPLAVRAEWLRRFGRVRDAEVLSLDEAFGRYWPAGTHQQSARDRMRLPPLVNRYVFEAIQADPARAINRILFAEIGERPDVARSGSVVEGHYYAGIAAGLVNVQALRGPDGALPRNSGEFSGEQIDLAA